MYTLEARTMIGNKIRELRTQRRMSQTDLGKALNVSQQTVTKWENSRAEPSSTAITNISNYFNVSADWLLGRSKERNPESTDFFDVMSFDGKPLDEHDKKLLADLYRTIKANKEE